jgi:hypothetical protein
MVVLPGWACCGMGTGLIIPALPAQLPEPSPSQLPGHTSAASQLSDSTLMVAAMTVTSAVLMGQRRGHLWCCAVAVAAIATASRVEPVAW